MATTDNVHQQLREGMEHLRRGEFFEAHEAWEIPWMEMEGSKRIFWQAMIQLSVGAYHFQKNNHTGCRNLWTKAFHRCEVLLADSAVQEKHIVEKLKKMLQHGLRQLEQKGNPLSMLDEFANRTVNEGWVNFR